MSFLKNKQKCNKKYINLYNNKWNSKYLEVDNSLNKKECVKIRRKVLKINKLSYNTNKGFYEDIYKKKSRIIFAFYISFDLFSNFIYWREQL